MSVQPASAEETAEAVRAHPRVAARGGGSKAALIGEGEVIELASLSGITEYEPSEYTFTARAGTALEEVEAALEAKGQYLPFDPLFARAGGTLGGTVAAGLSGPGRFRYGGIRDFLIGVQFVDGTGRLVRSGGKVVKNAAGFDLPKFLVGSLGRFAILTEVSFKVFPAQGAPRTFRISCPDHGAASERLAQLSRGPLEADAIDYDAAAGDLYVRFCTGIDPGLEAHWPGEVEQVSAEESARFWESMREMSWAEPGTVLVKVVTTPGAMAGFQTQVEELGGGTARYSAGGSVAWLAITGEKLGSLAERLATMGLAGLVVRGREGSSPLLGRREESKIVGAVKAALDPEGRFPDY